MGALKRLLLIACCATLLCIAVGTGVGVYYTRNPSKIKPLAEEILSRSTGTTCTIEDLTYGAGPLSIAATRIHMKPKGGGEGFSLEIPSLRVNLSLEGAFGSRTLLIRVSAGEGVSLRLSQGADLPAAQHPPGSPSALARAGRWLAAALLFRDVRLEAGEVTNGRIYVLLDHGRLELDHIHARFDHARPLELTCRAEVRIPSVGAVLRAPLVRMTGEGKISLTDPVVKWDLEFRGASFQAQEARARQISGKADMVLEADQKRLSFETLNLGVQGFTWESPRVRTPHPLDIEISGQGTVDFRTLLMQATRIHLRVPDLMEWAGSIKGHLGTNSRIEVRGMDSRLRPDALMALVSENLRRDLIPFELAGTVGLAGDFRLIRESGHWQWECSAEARFPGNPVSVGLKEIKFRGLLGGRVRVEGRFPDVRFSSTLETSESLLETAFARLNPFQANVSLTGTWPRIEVDTLNLDIPQAVIRAAGREFRVERILLLARKGFMDAGRKSILLPEISFASSLGKAMKISLSAGSTEARFRIRGQKTGLLEGLQNLDLFPLGWSFKGEDAIQVDGVLKTGGKWSLSAAFGIQKLAFQGPDPSWQGENLSLKGKIQGERSIEGPALSLTGSLQADRGEILLDRFYLDLNRNGLAASLTGSYRAEEKTFHFHDFQGGIQDILSFSARGVLDHGGRHPSFDLTLQLPPTPVDPAFQILLREPYASDVPFLQTLETAGGVSADLHLAGGVSGWNLDGRIGWHGGSLSSKAHDISLRGIELDLPLRLQGGKAFGGMKTSPAGRLAVESLSVPWISPQPLNMGLRAGPNSLAVEGATLLRTRGGILEIGPIRCEALLSSAPTVKSSLSAKEFDLGFLISKVWDRPVEGTLKGRLDPVIFRDGKVTSQGRFEVTLFGGDLTISRLGAEGLTTSTPVLSLDAHWEDISLSELTRETSFGKIEGSLKGHVRNLEIAHGQPQRFELLLETAEGEGVTQRISVTAVDNIAR
ncbi:MAG: hypothetical protein JW821_00375, partial [Deltaproteobacteria bacterium]|nr:hypothetical protein [Deltaproteobacteria bacterium]